MKIEISDYLQTKIKAMKKLIEILNMEYDDVSILGRESYGKNYIVNMVSINISDSMWKERGFVVRIINDGKVFEYSFNKFEDGIEQKAKEIIGEYKQSRKTILVYSDLYKNKRYIKKEYRAYQKENVFFYKTKDIVSRLSKIVKNAEDYSNQVVSFEVKYSPNYFSSVYISSKKEFKQAYQWAEGYLMAVVKDENESHQYYKSFSDTEGEQVLSNLEKYTRYVVDEAKSLLGAKKIKPGEYEVILAPDVAGILAHESFGHGVEEDMFVKKRALAEQFLNKKIANDKVTIRDGSKATKHVASYLFDDEGNLGTNTVIIDKGKFIAGINDELSAELLNHKKTGNARRESYMRKAYSRMTNTLIDPGDDKLEDMIKSIEHGYFIDAAMGGMEDPKNWGIQMTALKAVEIKGGELTDNVFTPVIITGYVQEVLKNISMVSDKIEIFGSGACGKGYKEFVKVSDGSAYIKTKVRLS